jgi:CubicO group peptidase (beta-lactamase class C family)
MTKPIVSVLALILMEQGRLRLFDPVSVYNPAFANMLVLEANGSLRPAVRPILV